MKSPVSDLLIGHVTGLSEVKMLWTLPKEEFVPRATLSYVPSDLAFPNVTWFKWGGNH